MRNLTKEDRTNSRNTQFEYLLREGYSRETYKALDIFTNFQHGKYYLKVFKGTAANHEAYFCYRTEEQRAEAVQRYKSSFDRTEAYKAEAKIRNKGKSSSHAAASAAIKAELTAAFPNIKFSCKSDSFSGGDSVHVSWTDGPTVRQVTEISRKYQYGHFDGMTDMYESTNRRDDIPQSKYVSESRHKSEQIQSLLTQPEFTDTFTEEEKNDYRYSPEQILYRVWAQTSFPAEYTDPKIIRDDDDNNREFYKIVFKSDIPEPKAQAFIEKVSEGIKIIEYGRGIAVIGQTKPFKDLLGKNGLGGIFQPRLECGAGWIFKKDRLQEVSDALQAAQEAQENKEPEAAQTTPELPETAIIPTPPHVQIVQDMNHIMSHFDPRHPVNICDPKSSQYREVIKELNEQPKHYDNLQDITEAAESGQVISLFNLSQLV